MESKEFTMEQGINIKVTMETALLKEDLHVYKYTSLVRNWKKIALCIRDVLQKEKVERQGFCTERALIDFKDRRIGVLDPAPLMLTTTEELLNYARYGTNGGSLGPAPVEKPFDVYQKVGINLDNVVNFDVNSYDLWNLQGELLPVAKHFGYIDAQIHDGRYDLEKALVILNENPRVRFETKKNRETEWISGEGKILDIPYYNRESGRNHYLSFLFEFTKEEINVIRETQLELSKRHHSLVFHKAVFDLDILGLRLGGAVKKKHF